MLKNTKHCLRFRLRMFVQLSSTLLIFCLFCLCLSAQVIPDIPGDLQYRSIIWVDPINGSDSNTGLSVDKAKETIGAGVQAALILRDSYSDPEARVVVKCLPGEHYQNGSMILFDRIDLKGYGRGKTIVTNFPDTFTEALFMGELKKDQQILRCIVTGFTFMEHPDTTSGNGFFNAIKVEINNAHGNLTSPGIYTQIHIENNSIFRSRHSGIRIDAYTYGANWGYPCHHYFYIKDNTISECGMHGINIINEWATLNPPAIDPFDTIRIIGNTVSSNENCGVLYTEEFSPVAPDNNLNDLLIARNNICLNGNNTIDSNNGVDLFLKGSNCYCTNNFVTHNGNYNLNSIEGSGIYIRSPHQPEPNFNHSNHFILFNTISYNNMRGLTFADSNVHQFIQNCIFNQIEDTIKIYDVVNVLIGNIKYSTFESYDPSLPAYAVSPDYPNNISVVSNTNHQFVEDYFNSYPVLIPEVGPFEFTGDMHIQYDSPFRMSTTYYGDWNGFDSNNSYIKEDYDGVARSVLDTPTLGADNWADNGYLYIYSNNDNNKTPRPIIYLGEPSYVVELYLKISGNSAGGTWTKIRGFTENSRYDPDILQVSGNGVYPYIYFITSSGYPFPNSKGAVDYDSLSLPALYPFTVNASSNSSDEAIAPLGLDGVFARGIHIDCHATGNPIDRRNYLIGYLLSVKGSVTRQGETNQFTVQLGVPCDGP